MRIHAIAALVVAAMAALSAQQLPADSACKPIASRTQDIGCWVLTDAPVGVLTTDTTHWYLDAFPTRAEADAARGARGTVFESLGRVWLATIGDETARPKSGRHVADIAPLPIKRGTAYSAMYMEAISPPGWTSATHTHSGPEAWYTEAGEMCLETPAGVMTGRAGGAPVIIPGGPPMHLTAIGKDMRRAIVLVLHDAAQPPITIEHAWTPTGACKGR